MKSSIAFLHIPMTDLRGSLLLLALVWCLLATIPALARGIGERRASAASFLAAASAVALTRPPGPGGRRRAGREALLLGGAVLTGGAAFALLAAAAPAVVGAGRATAPHDPWLWAAAVVLAPVFEELLYRERLLAALAPRTGPVAAALLSSAAFAAPHLEAAAMARAFAAGLGLSALMLAGRRLSLCIGLHSGLNLGALLAAA